MKPVRDTVLLALQCWKSLPGPDTPEPSEAGSSIKGLVTVACIRICFRLVLLAGFFFSTVCSVYHQKHLNGLFVLCVQFELLDFPK